MLNNQNIPWARLFIESVAIVASILVAFAIDAWWEDYRERAEERRYLASLRQEFLNGLTYITEREGILEEILKANEDLINQVQGADRASEESLYYLFSLLSRPTELNLPRAVFDDLISSGGTQLIRSDQLRIALAMYGRALVRFQIENDLAWNTWQERIQPLLEGRIPRVNRLVLGSFGRSNPGQLPFNRSRYVPDFEAVLADPVFEDVVAERWLRVYDRVLSIRITRELMQDIVRMIDEELGAREMPP